MEHFIRIAFWIAFFFLTKSVSSSPIPTKGDFKIGQMRDIKCESDSTFYAPENVKEECITAALECIKKELNGTVKLECADPNNRTGQAVDSFGLLITKLDNTTPAPTDSRECVCEKWPQTSFSDFLNKTESIIERVLARTQTT